MKVLFKKNIISISIICFVSAIFIAALHLHDNSFPLHPRSLCKVSGSLSISSKKVKSDNHFSLFSNHLLSTLTLPVVSERLIKDSSIVPFSPALYSITNKAPPYQS
jgi:hypothetical protein